MKQDGILAASVVETEQDKFQAIVKTAAPRSRKNRKNLLKCAKLFVIGMGMESKKQKLLSLVCITGTKTEKFAVLSA